MDRLGEHLTNHSYILFDLGQVLLDPVQTLFLCRTGSLKATHIRQAVANIHKKWGPVRYTLKDPAASPARRRRRACCALIVAARDCKVGKTSPSLYQPSFDSHTIVGELDRFWQLGIDLGIIEGVREMSQNRTLGASSRIASSAFVQTEWVDEVDTGSRSD